jgi:CDP-diacylglycerol---glycerol-3-phosphate 3-phosphatidyltransferase
MTTPSETPPAPAAKKPRPSRAERRRRRRSLSEDALNVPNLLTMGRVAVIPVVILLIDRGSPKDCWWAALVYSAAALTDLIDGWLARRMHVVSVLGKFLDPLADKLLVMAVLIYLIPLGRIPTWAVTLLLAREISVTGLRSIASSEGVVIAAGGGGKSKTALQMIGILALILGYPYELSFGPLDLGTVDLVYVGRTLVYISLFFSISSAFSYLRVFAATVEAREQKPSQVSSTPK